MVKNSLPRVDAIIKDAIYVKRISFITVFIIEIEEYREVPYEVYTMTKKEGRKFIDSSSSLVKAVAIAEEQEKNIREHIEMRRKGTPTMRQLATLFSLKVPIPLDLTFGQASDLISEYLPLEKEKRKAERALKAHSLLESKRIRIVK